LPKAETAAEQETFATALLTRMALADAVALAEKAAFALAIKPPKAVTSAEHSIAAFPNCITAPFAAKDATALTEPAAN
jgi:CheY-specific phosphatase CheX